MTDFKYALGLLSPASELGARELRELSPFTEKGELDAALNDIQRLRERETQNGLKQLELLLSPMRDITRTARELSLRPLSLVEAFELKSFLLQYKKLRERALPLIKKTGVQTVILPPLDEPLSVFDPNGGGIATFAITESFIEGIDRIRAEKLCVDRRLADGDGDRQALLSEHERLSAAEHQMELAALASLTGRAAPYGGSIENALFAVGRLDLLIQKAKLANRYSCGMPEIIDGGMTLVDAVNPRLADKGDFTPLSMTLARGATVITGANMGGKSVALSVAALSAQLVRYGIFPFARECSCELFCEVIAPFGDMADDARGLSTFGGEIVALKNATAAAREKSCFIAIDEAAKGTNAREGAAIAAAVTEYLNACPSVSLLTTHYDGVAKYANKHYRVAGIGGFEAVEGESAAARLERLKSGVSYGLIEAPLDHACGSEALTVCRAYGLDDEIVDSASKILSRKDEK